MDIVERGIVQTGENALKQVLLAHGTSFAGPHSHNTESTLDPPLPNWGDCQSFTPIGARTSASGIPKASTSSSARGATSRQRRLTSRRIASLLAGSK